MQGEVERYSNQGSFQVLYSLELAYARRQVFVEIKQPFVDFLMMTDSGLASVRRLRLINRWRDSAMKVARPIDFDSCVAMTWHSLRHCDATHIAVSLLNCSCSSLPNFDLVRACDDAVDS